ncbi:hypothetical protein [Halobacillus sp. K22]|uniref:hypothetical protein n=1 Tax=Halobacillus sp. K22 TaxID=3457431 RepID=UPI003FCC34DF
MESSESNGDDIEIKKAFFFYINERVPWVTHVLCLFIYVGGFFFHGIHVFLAASAKPGGFDYAVYSMEHVYAEERKKSVLGAGHFFLYRLHSHFCVFFNVKKDCALTGPSMITEMPPK